MTPHRSTSQAQPENSGSSAPDPQQQILERYSKLTQAAQDRVTDAIADGVAFVGQPAEDRILALYYSLPPEMQDDAAEAIAEVNDRRVIPASQADWHRFWHTWTNKVDALRARDLFESLRFSADGWREFWWGVDRHIEWAKRWRWPDGRQGRPAANPYYWLLDQRWLDRPAGPDGRPVLGAAEIAHRRREEQAPARQAAVGEFIAPTATRLTMPPPPKPETTAEIVARLRAAGHKLPGYDAMGHTRQPFKDGPNG